MDSAASNERAQRFEREILVHFTALYRAALRLTGQVSDAEDLVQETCLRAFKCLDQLRHPAAAKVWAFSILRSIYLRQEERQSVRGAQVSLDDITASLLTPSEVVQDAYESFLPPEQTLRREIREAMLKLPLIYREVLVLAHMAGFSYRELAQILGLPVGTVMSRLFRGRRMLRTCLRENRNPSETAP